HGFYCFKNLVLCIRAIPNLNKPLSEHSTDDLMEEFYTRHHKKEEPIKPEEELMDIALSHFEGGKIPDATEPLNNISNTLDTDDNVIWGPIMGAIDSDVVEEA